MLKLRREILVIAEHPFEADAARKLSAAQVVLSDDHGAVYEAVAEFAKGAVRYHENGSLTLAAERT